MNLQLWTASRLNGIESSIRRKVNFYAPLIDSLDFMGLEPATFGRGSTSTAIYRDGLSHSIAANVPAFEYSGLNALGLRILSGESVQFSALNLLSNANTLIWFEDRIPKSTPTNSNPIDSSGNWTGNQNIHVSHLCKANAVLSNSEIIALQIGLLDIAQSIPAPPAPPINPTGAWKTVTPSGARNLVNTVFTLPDDPDLNTLLVFCFGAGALERVASAPDTLEYTAGGTGNRTLTLGLAPDVGYPFIANYRIL